MDVIALIESRGVAAIDVLRRAPCERWLDRHGYDIDVLDFGQDFAQVLADLGSLLKWEDEFGYRLEEGRASLEALADGFAFQISEERGTCLDGAQA